MTEEKEYKKSIPITTTIPMDIWKKCKNKHLSWNFLLIRGYESIEGFERLRERAIDAETSRDNWERNFKTMRRQVNDLQKQIDLLNGAKE